jgi:hypothetical protein
MSDEEFSYLNERVDSQMKYFDENSIKYKKYYSRLKKTQIVCNILTTMSIALAFTIEGNMKLYTSILALILSTIVLGTYQLEEFQNFGAKWEKFRLVHEQIISEKYFFLNSVGKYTKLNINDSRATLVETIENIIRGTDISYFSLMVEPGKRIEKRLQNLNQ